MEINTNTFRVRLDPSRWGYDVEYKTLERRKVGSWFFGLFPIYKYFWSDWKS